jgi:hypothetical protein
VHEWITLGVLAVTLGVVVGVLVFVPLVALDHRRRGGFDAGRVVLWAVASLCAMGIWIWALLPLPDPETVRCAAANAEVTALADDLHRALVRPGSPASADASLAPLLLTVVLFAPVGFLLRVLGGKGIAIALVAGFALSAVVEVTQLTGVWGLYPCAYRSFDVVDLLAASLGAMAGSLVALGVPRRSRLPAGDPGSNLPQPVTRRRRLLAMGCDVLAAWLLSLCVIVVGQLALLLLGADVAAREGSAARSIGFAVPIVLWLTVSLATGGTVGDHVAALRYAGGPLPVGLARFLRFAGGIGGYLVLTALPDVWAFVGAVFAATSILLVFTTDDLRGLPGIVSGQRLVDARERDET